MAGSANDQSSLQKTKRFLLADFPSAYVKSHRRYRRSALNMSLGTGSAMELFFLDKDGMVIAVQSWETDLGWAKSRAKTGAYIYDAATAQVRDHAGTILFEYHVPRTQNGRILPPHRQDEA